MAAIAEFTAKRTSVCSKCGELITIGQPATWPRNGQKVKYGMGDKHFVTPYYHVSCSSLPDSQEAITKLVSHMRSEHNVTDEYNPQSGTVFTKPAEAPRPVALPIPTSNGNTDVLAGLALAMLPTIQEHIQLKSTELSEELEAKITAAIESSAKVIRIENLVTGETVNVGRQHDLFPTLLKRVQRRMHVYLWGEPGSGKSTAAQMAATALSLRYGYISLTAQTAESRIMGYMDANGRYVETEFYRCYKEGGVFCIDEMDNASANLLTALNSALENGHAAFPCGLTERHPDFVMVATGNTAGYGANPMFPERRPMDAAFRERFAFIKWDTDESLERSIALGHNENAASWVTWVQTVRKYARTNYPKLLVTSRASIKGAQLMHDGDALPDIAEMVLFKGLDKDSVTRIISANPLPR